MALQVIWGVFIILILQYIPNYGVKTVSNPPKDVRQRFTLVHTIHKCMQRIHRAIHKCTREIHNCAHNPQMRTKSTNGRAGYTNAHTIHKCMQYFHMCAHCNPKASALLFLCSHNDPQSTVFHTKQTASPMN